MVSHMVEYHNGMKMVRFHPGDIEGAHIYKRCIYPTGHLLTNFSEEKNKRNFVVLREEKNKDEKKTLLDFVNEATSYLAAKNYLGAKNRLYNYDFRNEECLKNKNCKLHDKLLDSNFNDGPFLKFLFNIFVIGVFALIVPVFISLLCRFEGFAQKQSEKKDFATLLDNQSTCDLKNDQRYPNLSFL